MRLDLARRSGLSESVDMRPDGYAISPTFRPPGSAPPSSVHVRHVLVVEDDLEMRRVISAALLEEGFAVAEANDGNVALSLCRRADPDVIVLDLGVPNLDGVTFAAEYRRLPGSRAWIIVISARDRGAETASRIRASTFFSKPFSLRELLAEVRRLSTQPPT